MQLGKIKKTLLEALATSGKILLRGMARKKKISFKSSVSLVTETDIASEKNILRLINKRFPDHSILAEESGASKKKSPHRWIIDPLDGTTNFAHDFPQACISIAYEFQKEVLLGGIYDPFKDELFFAEKGKGATLNRKRIHVSRAKPLKHTLLVTGFPYDRMERPDYYLNLLRAFLKKTHGIRRLGSSALDLCYVACGRFDGYWEAKLNPWDIAAGNLIVREAGGIVTDFWDNKHDLHQESLIAAHPKIHYQIYKELQKKL